MNLFLLFQNSSTEVTDSTVQNTSQTKSDVVSRLLGKGIGEINQMYETSNNLRLLVLGKGINVKCTKCTIYLTVFGSPHSICVMNQMYKTSQSRRLLSKALKVYAK